MRNKYLILCGFVALSSAGVAHAEDNALEVQPYIGVSVGYHDTGLGDEFDAAVAGTTLESNSGSILYGAVAGVQFPVGGNLSLAVEGNFHLGTKAIENEYGAAVLLGYNVEGSQLFLKAGYQEVNVDIGGVLGVSDSDLEAAGVTDDTVSEGDYLVGGGMQFAASEKTAIRFGVDTIAFDTIRGTASVLFKF